MVREPLSIPGEPRLTRQIREAARRDTLAHAVILSGQGDLAAAARFAAAAMECTGGDKPCGACAPCQKVLRGTHPDVVTVTDPAHKNIAVEVLRDMAADACVLPNEGRRKIYIFPDCSLLEPRAQNVLLKVVEDGPSHASFLFCARNSAVLLPTIRSRTVEWKLSPPEEPAFADGDGRAQELCRLLASGRRAELAAFCAELENSKMTREELRDLLSGARDLMAGGLAAAYGVPRGPEASRLAGSAGRERLSAAAEVLNRFTRACGYNIGVGHLVGALSVALEDSGAGLPRAAAPAPRP